jgi:hypothetical protein
MSNWASDEVFMPVEDFPLLPFILVPSCDFDLFKLSIVCDFKVPLVLNFSVSYSSS